MDFWSLILLITGLSGILGWTTSWFTNGLWWYLEWREGNPVDLGSDIAWTYATPFAWIFAITEIVILYSR